VRKEVAMAHQKDRRELLKLVGVGGGVVFASTLLGRRPDQAKEPKAGAPAKAGEDFFFLQVTDTHWGFSNPAVNPESGSTLKKIVQAIRESKEKPDFVIFTGDLTHTTDDDAERRKRMTEFKELVRGLEGLDVKYIPGEHDASLDKGKAFIEMFGETHGSFDHKGVHFLMIDNVSDPTAIVGEDQIAWIKKDLAKVEEETPVVVFTHRPLFDLYPQWDWATKDGAKVVETLSSHEYVTVFYGHIHQENHHTTGKIEHHSARSAMFPLPAPGSVPKKAPVPWDAAHPFQGIGYRRVAPRAGDAAKRVVEMDVPKA
jgi:3',5'-cyclic AMP phosphodiesterase CpdA